MAQEPASVVLRYLRAMIPPAGAADQTDRQLLEQFATSRDEAAFEGLVQRHGPLVWGVCRRRLRHHQDAEDAFQATFLVLARKAGAIRRPELLANWLYGVACRTAARAHADATRRRAREQVAAVPAVVQPSSDVLWRDLRPVLDEEVQRLPAKYRVPFILCYLEGRTNEEAARQIGCPKGTILSRLAWARERLRWRLERRGVTLGAGSALAILDQWAAPSSVSARLVEATMRTVLTHAAGRSVAGGIIATGPAMLAQGVLNHMILTQLKAAAAVVLLVSAVGIGALTYAAPMGKPEAASATPADARGAEPSPPRPADPASILTQRQLEAAIHELIQVQADIRKAKVELALTEAEKKIAAGQPIWDDEAEQWIKQDPGVQDLHRKIEDRRAALNQLESAGAKREDPTYRHALSQIEQLKKELARRRRELRTVGEEKLHAQRMKAFQAKLDDLRHRLTYLQELGKVLDADVQRLVLKARAQKPTAEERLDKLEKDIREIKAALAARKKN